MMEDGLIDVDLGGGLYKLERAGWRGRQSGGYRTLLSARIGSRYVFLHGFPKSDKANITQEEKRRCNSPVRFSWNCLQKPCQKRCGWAC
jgi:hypothetical protein